MEQAEDGRSDLSRAGGTYLAGLRSALSEVRAALASAQFPFELPGAPAARDAAASLLSQLDDYLLPRLRRLDAPLLAVVGGSTGAGKSTLVNSLIRAPITPAGVIRPTTRAPVLVANPADLAWFIRPDRLPTMARAARPGEQTLQTVSAPYLRPGLALIDAPDIDSVVVANRARARTLLAAGDLWLFVTTAARYADAVPWSTLRDARDRGAVVAVILNRLPPETAGVVLDHFAGMLAEQQLEGAPLFALNECALDDFGMLPAAAIAPVKEWLDHVAGDPRRRGALIRQTLLGAIGAVGPRLAALAVAAQDQTDATAVLARTVRSAYAAALFDVQNRVRDGAVLRGEVFARWRELVVDGELRAAVRSVAGRGRPGPSADPDGHARDFRSAAAGALAGLVTEANVGAAHWCQQRWRAHPAGTVLLAADANLGRTWAGFADAAHDLVHRWQLTLRDWSTPAEPGTAGPAADLLLLATIAAVSPPPAEITGTDSQAVALRAVLAAPGVAALGERARSDFLLRVGDLLSAEVDRHLAPVHAAGPDPALPGRLRDAAAALRSVLSGAAPAGELDREPAAPWGDQDPPDPGVTGGVRPAAQAPHVRTRHSDAVRRAPGDAA